MCFLKISRHFTECDTSARLGVFFWCRCFLGWLEVTEVQVVAIFSLKNSTCLEHPDREVEETSTNGWMKTSQLTLCLFLVGRFKFPRAAGL